MGESETRPKVTDWKVHNDNLTDVEKIHFWLNNGHEQGELVWGGWSKDIIPHVKLVSIEQTQPHPKITFSFTCQPTHGNRGNNLHGGAAATLFDILTTMGLVLISRPGFWRYLGVSRTLNVTYLRPVPFGMETLVECEILQIGKKVCALKGVMRRKSDGLLLAVCEHNKINVDPDVSKL